MDRPEGTGNPILIVAPMPRCGSTLLQRLVNSTRRAIIYGENFYLLDRLPDGLADLHRDAERKTRYSRLMMDRLLAGEDVDGTALYPDHESFLGAARETFYHMIRHYDRITKRYGFERWGLKHQVRSIAALRTLWRLLPKARWVYIYRDVLPVARSMKARWPKEYSGAEIMWKIGHAWRNGIDTMLEPQRPASLVLRYEALIADPAAAIGTLETYLGLEGIDRGVMGRKINIDPKALDPAQVKAIYREPAALTPEEEAAVLQGSAALRRKLGYAAEPPPPRPAAAPGPAMQGV